MRPTKRKSKHQPPIQPQPQVQSQPPLAPHIQQSWQVAQISGTYQSMIGIPTEDWKGVYDERDRLNQEAVQKNEWPLTRYAFRTL